MLLLVAYVVNTSSLLDLLNLLNTIYFEVAFINLLLTLDIDPFLLYILFYSTYYNSANLLLIITNLK